MSIFPEKNIPKIDDFRDPRIRPSPTSALLRRAWFLPILAEKQSSTRNGHVTVTRQLPQWRNTDDDDLFSSKSIHKNRRFFSVKTKTHQSTVEYRNSHNFPRFFCIFSAFFPPLSGSHVTLPCSRLCIRCAASPTPTQRPSSDPPPLLTLYDHLSVIPSQSFNSSKNIYTTTQQQQES